MESTQSTSLNELSELSDKIAEIRKEIDAEEVKLGELNKKKVELEGKLIQILEAVGLDSFRGSQGNFSVVSKSSVKVPATPEEKQAFFEWLEKRGEFLSVATVNSQTLNRIYREELEAFSGDGDFKIPGIGEPTFNKIISFRRGK